MDYPNHEEIRQQLLQLIYTEGGEDHRLHASKTYNPLANHFKLNRTQRQLTRHQRRPSDESSEPYWHNKVQSARDTLVKDGYIAPRRHGPTSRGYWKLTASGIKKTQDLTPPGPTPPPTKKQTPEHKGNVDVSKKTFYSEGGITELVTELRRRSPQLRKDAILKHGEKCQVCGFDFGNFYGDFGQGFIEVHHLKPLSRNKRKARNTTDDVRVVCSNCHRMLHRNGKVPIAITALKAKLKRK